MHYRLLSFLFVIVSGTCSAADSGAVTPWRARCDKSLQTGALTTWVNNLHVKLEDDAIFRTSFYDWFKTNVQQPSHDNRVVIQQGEESSIIYPRMRSVFADKNILCASVTLAGREHLIQLKQLSNAYLITAELS